MSTEMFVDKTRVKQLVSDYFDRAFECGGAYAFYASAEERVPYDELADRALAAIYKELDIE